MSPSIRGQGKKVANRICVCGGFHKTGRDRVTKLRHKWALVAAYGRPQLLSQDFQWLSAKMESGRSGGQGTSPCQKTDSCPLAANFSAFPGRGTCLEIGPLERRSDPCYHATAAPNVPVATSRWPTRTPRNSSDGWIASKVGTKNPGMP